MVALTLKSDGFAPEGYQNHKNIFSALYGLKDGLETLR